MTVIDRMRATMATAARQGLQVTRFELSDEDYAEAVRAGKAGEKDVDLSRVDDFEFCTINVTLSQPGAKSKAHVGTRSEPEPGDGA